MLESKHPNRTARIRRTPLVSLCLGRQSKALAASLVVASAFGFGLWLGKVPIESETSPVKPAPAVASLFVTPARTAAPVAKPADSHRERASKTLRLRSTRNVSSREAKAGDSVLFVTEQAMQTGTGQRVPAGALVEGVIAEARRSSTAQPGSLIIEIRALHAGSHSIPLHALPYIPKAFSVPAPVDPKQPRKEVDIRALGVRNQLRLNPDVEMPKETVIEFELVEREPFVRPLPDFAEPNLPAPFRDPAVTPLPLDPNLETPGRDQKPRPTSSKPRIAVDRG